MSDANTTGIRVPPHNDEAERSVLGACIINGDAWALVLAKLDRNDFYRETSRIYFDCLKRLFLAQVVPDVITMSDDLNRFDLLEAVGGPIELARLSSEVPSAANVQYYINIVLSKARLRRLANGALTVADQVHDGERTAEEIAHNLSRVVMEASGGEERSSTSNSAESAAAFWAQLEDELAGGSSGTSTGIAGLDEMLGGGLKPGRAYYVGALSKMGKTVFATHLAAHLFWHEGWAVDYVSVEQNAGDMAGKFIAHKTGIDRRELAKAARSLLDKTDRLALDNGWSREPEDLAELMQSRFKFEVDAITKMRATLKAASDELKSSKRFWSTLESEPNAHEIAMMVRARQLDLKVRGLDPSKYIAVFDYLQSFGVGGNMLDDRQRIATASRILSGISHDLNIPVLILFQMTKSADDAFAKYKRMPRFNDARGTGQIANDCNHMLIVHRGLRDDNDPARQDHCLVKHELSRDGGDGLEIEVHMDRIRSYCQSWTGPSLRAEVYGQQDDAAKGAGSRGSWD